MNWMKDELFNKYIATSNSINNLLLNVCKARVGSNYKVVREYLNKNKIDVSHWKVNTQYGVKNLTLKDVAIKDSPYPTAMLKKKIIKENIIEYKCSECENKGTWNNKKLVLVLDHINGIRNDHRLENIRFLCPNCNSQTSTFCGRNGRKKKYDVFCKCGNEKSSTSEVCKKCHMKKLSTLPRKTKINWPKKLEMKELLRKHKTRVALGKLLGVSDNAVKKRLIKYNLLPR